MAGFPFYNTCTPTFSLAFAFFTNLLVIFFFSKAAKPMKEGSASFTKILSTPQMCKYFIPSF